MNERFFHRQIERLKNTFGANVYSEERVRILWAEVNTLGEDWLARVIDELIGNSRFPPLAPEFREAVSKERERLREQEKREDERIARQFMGSNLAGEDIQTICQLIRKRINGGVGDAEYTGFVKMLGDQATYAAEKAWLNCKTCFDQGLIFEETSGAPIVYRCTCSRGQADGRAFGTKAPIYRKPAQPMPARRTELTYTVK